VRNRDFINVKITALSHLINLIVMGKKAAMLLGVLEVLRPTRLPSAFPTHFNSATAV
jgi:hypothetical protein